MNILVTGGAGYVGAELVFRLSQLPEVKRIVVYDNLSSGNYNLFISSSNRITSNNVEFVMGDLLDSRKLKKALKGIDVVYHLAAQVDSPQRSIDSHYFEQANNWGTAELCYAVEESDSVQKLVYLSSTGVYGFSNKEEAMTTSSRLNPRSFYPISKMRGEDHVKRLMDIKKAVIIRSGNVYGYSPTIRFDSVINRFLFDANFNNKIQIHGSGKQERPYVNLKKVIKTLSHLALNDVPGDVYNLVDGNVKVLDLVDIFKDLYPDLEFIFINQHLELRNLKVSTELKLAQYIDFEEYDLKNEIIEVKDKSFAF